MTKLQMVIVALIIALVPPGGLFAQSSRAVDLSRDTTLYAIGYAHLDTQWRWDYPTTIRDYIKNTLRDNFSLFEKYPGYIFNFSGSNRYRMMKEYYPEDYERLKRYVAAHRWFPCGSSVEESDVLIPSSESILRQVLYGNEFFRKELHKESSEYMLPDCFGFPASLPSILAHCGIKGFSTQKLTWGSAVGIPFNDGIWVGPDGMSVVAAFNPGDYVTQVRENLSLSQKWLHRISDDGKRSGVVADYMYYGTGDVGGSPGEESVRWIQESAAGPGPVHLISSTAERFFNDLTPEQKSRLPRYSGELLLTNHSAGSLTSQAYMKRWNRKNELLASGAEAASVIAEWLGGCVYPLDKLTEAWRLVLGAQFHDIMAGTCIPKAYEYSWNDEILAANQFGSALSDAAGSIIRAMNTEAKGVPVVVFNPLSFEREDVVEASILLPPTIRGQVRVYDPGNREVPSQVVAQENNRITLAFLAKVPPVGFATYDVKPSIGPCSMPTGLKISGRRLENSRYIVTLDDRGDVESILDKTASRQVLSEAARLAFLHERPMEYPAWNMDWSDRQKPPTGYVDGPPSIRIVESGPVRVALEISREARGSRFVQQIRLAAGGGADRVEFKTFIDWYTGGSSLKAVFPLTVSNPVATYNAGVGTLERGNNDSKKFEVPSHEWFDLTDSTGDYGVSILEDCKFGSDKPRNNMLRLTLLFTPGVRSGYGDQATQDFGKHEMLYAICGHRGGWREGDATKEGARLNQPLIAFQTYPHQGFLGKSFSFLRISSGHVQTLALKKAENSGDTILRIQETEGQPEKNVQITFGTKVIGANEVDGQERLIHSMPTTGKLVVDMDTYQLRTFSVRLQTPSFALSPPHSFPVSLPYDTDVISATDETAGGDFAGDGASMPGEMLPDSIVCEGIVFRLGPKTIGKPNALRCTGQTLPLPLIGFNRLYVLASSSGAATPATFAVNGKPTDAIVGPWSGFIGQWDNRIWDGYAPKERDYTWDDITYEGLTPGFVLPTNVAFFTTHRHLADGRDDPYHYCYLHKIMIAVPIGANTITLPSDPRIRILAMTAANNDNDATLPASLLYDTLNWDKADYGRFQVTPKPRIAPSAFVFDEGSATSVTIVSGDKDADIRYSLDGALPTQQALKYTAPITVKTTTSLRAIAYSEGKHPSLIDSANYYAAQRVESVEYLSRYSPKYPGGGAVSLIDRKRGTIAYSNSGWQGFEGNNLDVVLDLGREMKIRRVTLGCLSDNTDWIFLPLSVEVTASVDGKTFGPPISKKLEVPTESEDTRVADLSVDAGDIQARYLRVKAENIGKCPPWHQGAGGVAWLFVDEIVVE